MKIAGSMMKKVIILLIVILITMLSCSPNEKPTSKKILIESRTIKYKYSNGKLDSPGTLYERIIFNKQGRDSIIENYNDSGSLILRTILYYDSTGNKVKSLDYKPDGKIESTTKYKYSDNGKIIESFRQHTGGGINRGQFIYDSLGNRIKEIWNSKWYIDYRDELYSSEVILLRTYNDKGFCIGVKESTDGKAFEDKKTVFDSLGQIIYEDWGDNFQKYTYDKNGNEIEHLYLDTSNKLVWRWVSMYDTNNVRIEYTTYNSLSEPIEVLKTEMIYK
jgi:hypothetical protein